MRELVRFGSFPQSWSAAWVQIQDRERVGLNFGVSFAESKNQERGKEVVSVTKKMIMIIGQGI